MTYSDVCKLLERWKKRPRDIEGLTCVPTVEYAGAPEFDCWWWQNPDTGEFEKLPARVALDVLTVRGLDFLRNHTGVEIEGDGNGWNVFSPPTDWQGSFDDSLAVAVLDALDSIQE